MGSLEVIRVNEDLQGGGPELRTGSFIKGETRR
jgi:hypothetical protein